MEGSVIPPLVRLFVINYLLGFLAASVFVGMLYAFNVANLWTLVINSATPVLATFLLWFFNGIVFAGVQVGIAVMRMAEPTE